jgi:hypothetical protein
VFKKAHHRSVGLALVRAAKYVELPGGLVAQLALVDVHATQVDVDAACSPERKYDKKMTFLWGPQKIGTRLQ